MKKYYANALHLWAIMQNIPIGKFKHILKFLMNYMMMFRKCHRFLKILLLKGVKMILLLIICLIISKMIKYLYIKVKNYLVLCLGERFNYIPYFQNGRA
jgi:hypothetical protein